MRDTIFTLIGRGVIRIQIKEFRGKKYVNSKLGNITEKLNGNKQTRM
jgi:hypothetical protein